MKKKEIVFFVIISVIFFVLMFFSALQLLVNNDSFFKKFFDNYDLYQTRGITTEEGIIVIDEMVDYMEGKTKELKLKNPVLNFNEYSEKETLHMVDVKNIYSFFKTLRNISCILYIITLVYIFKKYKNIKILKKSIISFIISILLFLGLFLAVVFNFDGFWLKFHEISFNNNLWSLNYSSDLMINVCSNEMFKSIILNSFAIYILLSVVWLLVIYIYQKKQTVNKKCLTAK